MIGQNEHELNLGWLREKAGLLQGTTKGCATGDCLVVLTAPKQSLMTQEEAQRVNFIDIH